MLNKNNWYIIIANILGTIFLWIGVKNMSIEFKEAQITKREKRTREPFIGYFSPNGKLINYNVLLGGNYHVDWCNPVSLAFLSWISYIIEGTSIEKLKERALFPDMVTKNQYPGIDEYVIRGYGINYEINYESFDFFIKTLYKRISDIEEIWHTYGRIEEYTEFEYQLLLFFKNAYRDKKFFDTIQRKISIKNPNIVKKKLKYKYRNCILSDGEVESFYRDYLKEELLSHLKDICVQYLGYDSLEKFKPNGVVIKVPSRYEDYDFDFLTSPRIITSSYPNVNERYYNYLLMDWAVHRLPRYYYNERTGLYEKSNFSMFYQSETEQKLEKEIRSIKKLVPLEERKRYFR